ncbi:hypothetical protein Acsp04_39060 [Actinomadura sp. NBRC 104425]|uniref:DUF3631 domain-containing protein n=1 Tax=Actinomadura sp. NBRC 104425 TaxID=3032204 RepID=UPI0024A1FADA|nr:DUF3631 domain-containing protein [Actinomadura sp. NBRC 104425]GLZ13671.1 hypothetical protein Acsp04_39060 [Actinomadura sp. NBRC 104425]
MNLNDLDAPLKLNGAQLLDELRAAFVRYVILPSDEAYDAVTLWTAATHAQPAWQHATRLVITAPEKRCGKSRLMDVITETCHDPLITVNISPAALVRSIDDDPPTLLLDEADTVFGKKAADAHEDLRGLINAGHQRGRPYVRWDATLRQPEHCPTFAMAALAGIGSLPDTIEDRAVIVKMRRRAPGERVRPFRTRRDAPALHDLRDRITAWIRGRLDALTDAEPDMPVEDRAADNWEPLIAVADEAGGDWPERARKACKTLTGQAEEDTSVGVRLLADLREVFGDAEALHVGTILNALHKLDESPWADWYGRPFTPRDLAKMLKPYGVSSRKVKINGVALQGYRREHLHDAWSRYLPPRDDSPDGPGATQSDTDPPGQEGTGTSGTSGTSQVNGGATGSGSGYANGTGTGDPHSDQGSSGGSGGSGYPPPGGECAVPGCTQSPRRACWTCADHMTREQDYGSAA